MSLPIRKSLYGKMAGDTTLTNLLGAAAADYTKAIYFQMAPSDAAYPYVVFQKQAGTPTYTFKTGHAVIDTDVWMVKAVDRNSTADEADTIAARLDALLTDGALSISGATQLYLRRESDVDYAEVVDGKQYKHSGATFRLAYEPS